MFVNSSAQNRLYTVGGCNGDCSTLTKQIFYSNDLRVSSGESNYSSCDTHIESFTKLTTESMPSADEQYQAVYNNKSSYNDCIFVFGGSFTKSDVLCFNVTSLSLTKNFGSPTFVSSTYRLSRKASLLIVDATTGDEFIYYTTVSTTPSLYKFDILNGVTTKLNGGLPVSSIYYPPCMLQNPFDDDQLLFVEGIGDAFLVYSINDDSFTVGQSLYTPVNRAFCVVIDNEYMNDEPYLYVIGGQHTDILQRLQLNNDKGILNTGWELMIHSLLYVNDSSCDANWTHKTAFSLNGFLHDELIYYFFDCVVSFNILNHSMEYVTNFSDVKSRFGGV